MIRWHLVRGASLVPLVCLGAVPIVVCLVLAFGPDPRQAEAARPIYARDKDYVGASTCRSCHPDHTASWRRTYHSTMTQVPSRASVLGRFDGGSVTFFGATATPFERDGHFFFSLPAFGGEGPRQAEVALCVGSRRYQQYFERVADQHGVAYRRLPLFWHVAEARWMHLNGAFLEADSDDWGLHQAIWNLNCIFCHNTGITPGVVAARDADGAVDESSKTFNSHVADLGIACEACHGPGREHVRRNGSPLDRYWTRYRTGIGLGQQSRITDPLAIGQTASAALCGQCHSQRVADPLEKLWTFLDTGPTFRPGGTLEGHVKPVTRDTPTLDPRQPELFQRRFWADGTARLTGYEYLGVTQSPCWRGGRFTCSSCHTMHGGDVRGQIQPDMRGDRACTQCHAEIARDVPAHTHHATTSTGSRCLECHMPRAVYGILAIHRSHRVEVPDVKRDVEGGRPNACTTCHLDRTSTWAAERMRQFWGARFDQPRSRPDGAPLDIPEALASLHAGDPLQRVVYAFHAGRADAAVAVAARGFVLGNVLVTLGDSYGAVRFIARQSALRLDAGLGTGLQDALRGFDVQALHDVRDPAYVSLLRAFEGAARAHLSAPPTDALLGTDYGFERQRVLSLLSLQARAAIEVGE